jgi:hypothetical protein
MADDLAYTRATTKLAKLTELDRGVLLITKDGSRGIDIQFKSGAPPSHVIIAYPPLKSSELQQAIGRSCR